MSWQAGTETFTVKLDLVWTKQRLKLYNLRRFRLSLSLGSRNNNLNFQISAPENVVPGLAVAMSPENLLELQLLGPNPEKDQYFSNCGCIGITWTGSYGMDPGCRNSDSIGLWQGRGICISNKLVGDSDAGIPQTTAVLELQIIESHCMLPINFC